MQYSLLHPGTRFCDRFEIRGARRRGGQAEIYPAFDSELNCPVALKVARAAASSTAPDWYLRLRDEARLLARLRSCPWIVQIFDLGRPNVEDDGRLLAYVVLEWMEGGSASQWMARIPPTDPGRVELATRIAVDAARGLAAAHAEMILHCDVTPDNILLNDQGVAKLADFGVAIDVRQTRGVSGFSPRGKADFASPEQKTHGEVDARSDIYSLGATYFFLLTGRVLDRPGDDPRALCPAIPLVCAAVVRKATDLDPQRRYQTASELLNALIAAQEECNDPTLPAYLAWLQQAYGALRLPVINREVPLDRVYTALRVVPTSLEERRRVWRMLVELMETGRLAAKADAEQVDDAEAVARVVEFPYILTLEFRDPSDPHTGAGGKPLTLGDAYAECPVLVILGDPGSGKTTIGRWLVRAAAQCRATGAETFQVRRCQIDPTAPDDETPVDLGKARLPIFVRAADYALRCEDSPKAPPSLLEFLTLTDDNSPIPKISYTGDAPERLRHTPIPRERIARMIRSNIEAGTALIVIDGLDEIPLDHTRSEVRNAIQDFISDHMRKGNKVVLTSRIVGYQLNSLEGLDIAHVVVEPMEEPAVRHFVRSWLGAVIADPADAIDQAVALTREIFSPDRHGLRDLATNPLLAGVLTAVYHRGRGLPETRVALFESAIQEFLGVWEARARQTGIPIRLNREQVVQLLEPLAEFIHTEQTTGLVHVDELRRRLTRLRVRALGHDESAVDVPATVVEEVASLIELIREPVGLLVARYENVYAFIHRAFQEYLAARYLLHGNVEAVAESFRPRMDLPLWREPLLMALGRLAQTEPDQFLALVRRLFSEDGRYHELLPREALLVVAALPDLARCPVELVKLLMERLLRAMTESGGPTPFVALRELIEGAIPQIRRAHDPAAEASLLQALAVPELAPAAAAVVLRHEWFTPAIADAMIEARPLDSAAWGWPIHAALREMATPTPPPKQPDVPAAVKTIASETEALERASTEEQRAIHQASIEALERDKAEEIANYRAVKAAYDEAILDYQATGKYTPKVELPALALPFRADLSQDQSLRDWIVADPAWATLIVGLYGGLGDHRTPSRLREYYTSANFLQLPDNTRRGFVAYLKERWGEEDPVYQLAKYLDTTGAGWLRGSRLRPDLLPQFVADDSPLTEDLIRPALKSRRPAHELIPDLNERLQQGSPEQRADALLALVLLGAGDPGSVATHFANPVIRDRLTRAFEALRDPVVRMANHLNAGLASLAHEVPRKWAEILSAILAVLVEESPAYVDLSTLYDSAPAEDRASILAEHLVGRFRGGSDDAVYNAAVALDLFTTARVPPEVLVRALALAPLARHRRRSVGSFRWEFEQSPPRTFSRDDIPLFALTAIDYIDRQISMVRAWAVGEVLRPILQLENELLPELLAVALQDMGDRSDRGDLISRIDPNLNGHADPHHIVHERAMQLDSPYHQARALLRLLPFFPTRREELLDRVRTNLPRIEDPHRRVQVMERLLAVSGRSRPRSLSSFLWSILRSPGDDLEGMIRQARRAVDQIRNPDDKARALARLASNLATADASRCLFEAMQLALSRIEEDRQLAETVRLLMPQLAAFPEVKQRVLRLPRAQTPRIRDALLDRVGPTIIETLPALFRHDPGGAAGWAAIAAAARLRDFLPVQPTSCDPNRLWEELATSFQPDALTALRVRAETEGLALTRTAAYVLDRLDPDQLRAIAELLPYLHSPAPETTPLLLDWLSSRSDALRLQAALLLAERYGLAIETLPDIVTALSDVDDRIRLRALRVVQHPAIIPEVSPTRLASVIGLAPLMELARKIVAVPRTETKRGMLFQVVGNLGSDLVHDSPDIFQALIEVMRSDPGIDHPAHGRLPEQPDPARDGIAAELLLGMTESVGPAVWDVLLEALIRGPIPVRMALFRLLMKVTCRTANRPAEFGLTPERWADVARVIDGLPPNEIPDTGIYLGGVEGVFDVIESALDAGTTSESRLAHARMAFQGRIRTLAELRAEPPELKEPIVAPAHRAAWLAYGGGDAESRQAKLLALFAGLGSRLLFAPGDCQLYLRPSEAITKRLQRRVGMVGVLFDWMRDTLSRRAPEPRFIPLESTLLQAACQAASVHPEILPIRPDRERIAALLIHAAQFQADRVGRAAALILLGRLLVADEKILPALTSALIDVDDVRQAALISVSLFRRYALGFLPKLIGRPEDRSGLYHRSAVVAFGFANLLETLGRSDRTSVADRQSIVAGLADAVRHPYADRVVNLEYAAPGLPELPRLNQVLYRMLLRVAGVESPQRGHGSMTR